MIDGDMVIVYEAIKKHGDSFWNGDRSEGMAPGQQFWNGSLFDEIVEMLNKDGYDLKVVKL